MLTCAECKSTFAEPFRRTWWEKIDGENWEQFSEESCPRCGSTEIYEPSEYDLKDSYMEEDE